MDELNQPGMKLYRSSEYPKYCPLFTSIKLSNGMITTLDPEDWIRLHKYTWHAKKGNGGWYAYRKVSAQGRTKHIYMHREIMHAGKGVEVHHQNNITLYNVKENLELLDPLAHAVLTKFRRIQRRQ